jgi:TatD DNase family protein
MQFKNLDQGRWIDAHCHMADPRCVPYLQEWIHESQNERIQGHAMGGVDPSDWSRQLEIKKLFPEHQWWTCFGLHPYKVHELKEKSELDFFMDQLSRSVSFADLIGETGLDLRPAYASSFDLQMESLELHFELAHFVHKPLVFHVVQAWKEFDHFLQWNTLSVPGIFHSFSQSAKNAESLLNRGFYLSIGPSVLNEKNKGLHQALEMIPLERLLCETDLPDQRPVRMGTHPLWQDLNQPSCLIQVAQKIASIQQIDFKQVLNQTTENFLKIVKMK